MLDNTLVAARAAQPPLGQTLGQVVDDSEAKLFVGRGTEMAALHSAVEAARTRPVALYLQGPAGVGKSALLRAFSRSVRAQGIPTVHLDASGMAHSPEQIERSMAEQLELPPDRDAASPAIVAAINARAAQGGMLVMLDAYDELGDHDAWLRTRLFRQLGPGVCLILAGRVRAGQFWSRDLGWTRALVELSLRDLSEAEAGDLFRRCGIADEPVWAEAYAITGGRPQLLALAANALLLQPDAGRRGRSRQDADRLALFLIEHILHPGSRRRAWRAGAGASELDGAIAAAAVLPAFDRRELAAMVGRAAVDGAWPTLLSLSTPEGDGRSYQFPPALRRRLAAAVARQRPWSERRWRRTSIDYRIRLVREGRGPDEAQAAWHRVAHLARESAWWPQLNPPVADGTLQVHRVGSPPQPGDYASEAVLQAAGDARVVSETSLLVSTAGGETLGRLALTELRTGPDEEQAAEWARQLPDEEREKPVAAGAVLWHDGVATAPGALGVLIREACGASARHRRIVAVHPGGWQVPVAESPLPVLKSLGFRPATDASDDVFLLDLEGAGYADWLNRVAQPRRDVPLAPGQWAVAAKEALLALDDPDQLVRSGAARYYVAIYGNTRPSTVRAWVLDALASADLGDAPPSGRVLLTLYYIERIGPHEAVAERMNLPRTTYFRCHRQALKDLGASLFC